jgi:hypothetical protein
MVVYNSMNSTNDGAHIECRQCPILATTRVIGAIDINECLCSIGHFGNSSFGCYG